MKKGFTLLETLIAMVILSTGIILLNNSWGGSFMRLKKSKIAYEVSLLLERKVTEIELEYRGKPLEEIKDEDSGDFGESDYTWEMRSKELELPDLSALMQGQQDKPDEMTMMLVKTLTDILQKSVKEVTVSVLVKGGKKKLKYSVTTYFVDYNKEVPLPGVPGP